ncbi:hypothetical protein ACP70R_039814 [Stipagrostis hirtigluma subsp. patula]
MDGDNTMSWSDLPADLVSAVAGRLTELADLARFRSVCPSWRSASEAHASRLRVPLLLLPTEGYGGTRVNRRAWSLADDRLRKIPVPEALGRYFLFASHHGWMLSVAAGDLSATLVYPFAGGSAGLPALPSSFGGVDNEKRLMDLVWDWSPHGVVVSMPGKGAFFSRPGDESWRPVGCSSAGVTGVTYCDGAFYLLDGETCKVTAVNAETLAVDMVIEPPALKIRSWCREANIVVSPDEILLLVRTALMHRRIITRDVVKVFRANRAAGDGSPVWSEVAGVGDRAVFVDHLRAFCVEATALNGLRRNCIYVASAHEEVNDDYGMDVNGHYTTEVLDIAELTTVDLSFGKLRSVWCGSRPQWPSWSLPNLH